MQVYDFNEQLKMSQGIAINPDIEVLLMLQVPGAKQVYLATKSEDRNGTDWWVARESERRLSIDVKVRSRDWATRPLPGHAAADDLALETWSVTETRKVGWPRDPTKQTDYILWFWTDTLRWCLVPFVLLSRVFQEKWEDWSEQYKTRRQESRDNGRMWHSECVFVPRRTVWAEIYNRFGGQPK